jgi:hypothetical protein
MERFKEYLKHPWAVPALYVLAGIIFGWFVLGWGLFPVEWKDATPAYLRQDLKLDYLRMAVDSYGANGDSALANQRWVSLGNDATGLFQKIQDDPKAAKLQAITGFAKVVQAGTVELPASVDATDETLEAEKTTDETVASGEVTIPEFVPTEKPKNSLLPVAVGAFCVLSVILVFAVGYIFIKKGGKLSLKPNKVEAIPSAPPVVENQADKGAEYFRPATEAPVSQFMTTYMQGDEQYDDSFSIDNPVGEFLGECGVGITETIGVGEPKKAAAFEIWLFDKNDIQTVTKVLMSEHAFKDPTMQQKLLSKGEPILAEPGKRILLETATLQLEARIVDMNFGQGPLPTNSYFERLTLELAVWPKVK